MHDSRNTSPAVPANPTYPEHITRYQSTSLHSRQDPIFVNPNDIMISSTTRSSPSFIPNNLDGPRQQIWDSTGEDSVRRSNAAPEGRCRLLASVTSDSSKGEMHLLRPKQQIWDSTGEDIVRESNAVPEGRGRLLPGASKDDKKTLYATTSTNQSTQPQKIYVEESEIDFETPVLTPSNIVARGQKGRVKDQSLPVDARPRDKDKKLRSQVQNLKDGTGLAFKDAQNRQWTKGVYHDTLRHDLIAEDKSRNKSYVYKPDNGNGKDDITSRCSTQRSWTNDPATLLDPDGQNLFDSNYKGTYKEKPSDWLLPNGVVVLDTYGHPVRNYRGIPNVLSSQLEGFRIEALRALTGMKISE